jgi:alkanesulfonate monooxygenase SsuD/methylene tetrahydromethanopterin reductase-like flavin-dependent oxidoreductase (luciferase family)
MGELLFGLGIPAAAAPGADPVGAARAAEELGFDFVGTNDHLHGSSPSFETWTLLVWIAAATSRIRVATRVLATPMRPPPVVAKMAESLDRLSGGRLILGLGGGSMDEELAAFGLGARSPRDKVDGMEEAIRIMRGMWSQERFSFSGRLYRTEGARIEPKPDRRIPIWLGTYGSRALAVTGRLADGWIPSLGFAAPEQIPAMRDRVLAAARDAGRDPAEITCAYNLTVRVDEHAEPRPDTVTGPPGLVVERLLGFLELGFTALSFIPTGPDPAEQAHRLAREVLPALRAAG